MDLPRKERAHKLPIERKDVIEILNACKDMELKTAILLLACTGARAIELCSLRLKDLDLDGKAPAATFRKEFTKMREDRRTLLTKEAVNQLRVWQKTKYAPHRTTITGTDGKEHQEYVTPEPRPDDMLLGTWHKDNAGIQPKYIASRIRQKLGEVLTIVSKDALDERGKRRAITLHSFRRFVKTIISNQGYGDFSEWHIGHATSGIRQTYFNQSQQQSLDIFAKIEPSLTFLDANQIESYHADIQSKLQEKDAFYTTMIQQLRTEFRAEIDALKRGHENAAIIEANREALNLMSVPTPSGQIKRT